MFLSLTINVQLKRGTFVSISRGLYMYSHVSLTGCNGDAAQLNNSKKQKEIVTANSFFKGVIFLSRNERNILISVVHQEAHHILKSYQS